MNKLTEVHLHPFGHPLPPPSSRPVCLNPCVPRQLGRGVYGRSCSVGFQWRLVDCVYGANPPQASRSFQNVCFSSSPPCGKWLGCQRWKKSRRRSVYCASKMNVAVHRPPSIRSPNATEQPDQYPSILVSS